MFRSHVHSGVGMGEHWGHVPPPPTFQKCPFSAEQSALYLREKCRLDCIFCPMAFDLWLDLFLYFGIPLKILLFSGKILICPEKFCDFSLEKNDISGKIFSTSGKLLSFSGENMICYVRKHFCYVRKIFWDYLPPPPPPTFPGKFFRCPSFQSKSAPRSLAPPPHF